MKKKNILITMVILAITILLGACAGKSGDAADSASKPKYIKITAEEAKKRMDENDRIIIVDVRTESEFNEKHIEGAILIPNESIGDKMPAQLQDKDAEILVYCRSGNRSRQATEKLIAIGYTKVYDFGGIIDWPYD